MFTIDIDNRVYDCHRPAGCTVVVIQVPEWPGNEFGLWLPEAVFCRGETVWGNWFGDVVQTWQHSGGAWTWSKTLGGCRLLSTLRADAENMCLWYEHRFENHSETELAGLSTQTCFHLGNAPEFISIRGERIWACLDDTWTTTDRVPRHASPDPRRVWFLRKGIRTERTVVPFQGFPSATMPEAACHPLLVAERFDGNASVGIACRNFRMLFNNNDCILRCLHSEPFPLGPLRPGQAAAQEGIILFSDTGHRGALERFETLTGQQWKDERGPPCVPRDAGMPLA